MNKVLFIGLLCFTQIVKGQNNQEYVTNGRTLKVGDTIQLGIPTSQVIGYSHILRHEQDGSIFRLENKNWAFRQGVITNLNVPNAKIPSYFEDNVRVISFEHYGIVFYADIEGAIKRGEIVLKLNNLSANSEFLTPKTAFVYYAKGLKTLPDTIVKEYLHRYMRELYTQAHDDEFAYQDAVNTAKTELLQSIKNVDFNNEYVFYLPYSLTFSNYDFGKGGFLVEETSIDFEIIIGGTAKKPSSILDLFLKDRCGDYCEYRAIDINFVNFNKFRFVEVPKEDANFFLKRRKNERGNVDRNIYAFVKIKFVAPKPNSKQLLSAQIMEFYLLEFQNQPYNLIGIVKASANSLPTKQQSQSKYK